MRPRVRRLFFSGVFCLTGVGNALVGATLPAVLARWHLSDSRGGLLLLAMWGGSTCGAPCAQAGSALTAAIGLGLCATGLLLLAKLAFPLAPLLYATYGLGLGMTMTSISLMRAREAGAAGAGIALNRLNLLWALGALCAPFIALRSLRHLSVFRTFLAVGALFALCGIVAFALSRWSSRTALQEPLANASRPAQAWAPLPFCLFAAAAVGMESALGSWLATYSSRSAPGVVTEVSATAAFWAGLLISRAASSLPALASRGRWRGQVSQIATLGVALALLLCFPDRLVLALGALLSGLALGPLYPWVLSVSLPQYRSTAVFVLAGVGAAVIPWLTGVLSSASGSLRIGLLAPVAGFLLLLTMAFRLRRLAMGEAGNPCGSGE